MKKIDTDVHYPLVALGEICDILNGYAFKSSHYVENGIRVMRITNVQKGKIVGDNPKFYPVNTSKEIEKYQLIDGDILLSLTGNVGRVGIITAEFLPAALNQRVACLRSNKNKILTNYLFYVLNHGRFEDDCMRYAGGVAQKNLSTVWLAKYKIPLPPLKIQKQIVERIEVAEQELKILSSAQQENENLISELQNSIVDMILGSAESERERELIEWVELGQVLFYEQPTRYIVRSTHYDDRYLMPVLTAGKSFILGFTDEKEGVFPREKLPVILFDDFTTSVQYVDFPFKVKSSAMKILHTSKNSNARYLFEMLQRTNLRLSEHRRYWISIYTKHKIPLPSLKVQEKIVQRIEQVEQELKTIEQSNQDNKQRIESLKQSIISGILV